ncbi:uncharacterized protein VTP21DRAFT_10419 [Calcarisporiella thermophila]|uniref:uncharacterized protein n=1 Tax=Calcarisporiella thermophila TaxID=911321 RepID=UPI003743D7DF
MGGGPSNSPTPPFRPTSNNMHELDEFSFQLSNLAMVDTTRSENLEVDSRVRLVFSKSKVYIHPSNDARDNVPGFLCVVEESPGKYLLAFVPESLVPSNDQDSYVRVEIDSDNADILRESSLLITSPLLLPSFHTTKYGFSIPFEDILSIRVLPPSLSRWYGSLIVNRKLGDSLGPLWFHDDESLSTIAHNKHRYNREIALKWGGEDFMNYLEKIVRVIRSESESNLFLIETKRSQKLSQGSTMDNTSGFPETSVERQQTKPADSYEPFQMDPLMAAVKEVRWNILERFSKVARFSRDAAATILDHPFTRPIVPLLPSAIQSLSQSDQAQRVMEEYDSARVYLAKWAAGAAAHSAAESSRIAIGHSALGNSSHFSLWRGLEWEEETELGVFEVLNNDSISSDLTHTRTSELKEDQWLSFFDDSGRLKVPVTEVQEAVFRGGINSSLRIEVWKYFLGIYPWDSSESERSAIRREKAERYWKLKSIWWDDPDERQKPEFKEQKHRIEKDVIRTDRTIPFYAGEDMPNPDPESTAGGTNMHLEILKDILITYNFYNTDLGYVQGMSDLLAPIFAVMGNEVDAFWCFVGFMERMKSNFYRDQSGMHCQLMTMDHLIQFLDPRLYKHLEKSESLNLFFIFRWLLIWFKREFAWEDVMRLWEVLWSDHLSTQFHLFFALAILEQHRDVIIDHLKEFDEILKYINDLSMTINLEESLQRAECLFYQFRKLVGMVEDRRMQIIEQLNEFERSDSADDILKERLQEEERRLPVISDLLKNLLDQDGSKMH